MQPDDICFLSALELRDLYASRDLSPVEVTRAILDRLEAVEPALNAFVTVTAELALEQAAIAERAFADGGEPSLLAGIPFSLKDLTATRATDIIEAAFAA